MKTIRYEVIYLRIALLVLFFCSCSSINYVSKGDIPVRVNKKKDFSHRKEVIGQKNFYLWGMLPLTHTVEIDREFRRKTGLVSVGDVVVEEFTTLGSILKSILSLGMFASQKYRLSGYGILPKDFDE